MAFALGGTRMANSQAQRLMQQAWATRRSAFEADPRDRLAALARAHEDLSAAADICRREGPLVSYAHAIHLLANLEVDLGNEEKALALWEEAVAVLRTTDSALELAHKVRHLGDLHSRCGRLNEAGSCYEEAVAMYRKHSGSQGLDFANAISRMADLKDRRGDRVEAFGLWVEARDAYAALGAVQGVEDATRRLERLEGRGQ
jgi:tetratricopeptide (TPR) repeat protein